MGPFVFRQRVRAQDCAESGNLGHPRYFEYLEAAMTDAWREMGEPLAQFFASGRHLTVAQTGMSFFAPARFEDLIEVEVAAGEIGNSSFELEYHVRRDETTLAHGRSRYVCTDSASGDPIPLPDEIRKKLSALQAEKNDDDLPLALTRFYGEQDRFYRGGKIEPLAQHLTEDVTWHVPGNNDIAGHYVGKRAVLGYLERRRQLSNSSLRIITGKLFQSGDLLVQFAQGKAELGAEPVYWHTFGVFRLRRGRIAACWLVPLDQAEFDRLWSSPLVEPRVARMTSGASDACNAAKRKRR